jgi:hypothetical protein
MSLERGWWVVCVHRRRRDLSHFARQFEHLRANCTVKLFSRIYGTFISAYCASDKIQRSRNQSRELPAHLTVILSERTLVSQQQCNFNAAVLRAFVLFITASGVFSWGAGHRRSSIGETFLRPDTRNYPYCLKQAWRRRQRPKFFSRFSLHNDPAILCSGRESSHRDLRIIPRLKWGFASHPPCRLFASARMTCKSHFGRAPSGASLSQIPFSYDDAARMRPIPPNGDPVFRIR